MTDARNNALTHMKVALKLLDESSAPLHIGARLEFVIHQLEESIAEQAMLDAANCHERAR